MNVHSAKKPVAAQPETLPEELPEKKAAALQATLELISEQGFQGTPMSQIAARADIGVGTIYRYFANKDDLLNALYLELKSRLTRALLQNYSPGAPISKSFKQVMRNIVHYYVEHPAELSFSEQYESSPLITEATREQGARLAEPIIELFERARKQHVLKDLPLKMLAVIINGSIVALAKLYLSGTVKMDVLDAGLDAIWDAIKR